MRVNNFDKYLGEILSGLSPEEQETFTTIGVEDRVTFLAKLLNKSDEEMMQEIVNASGLELEREFIVSPDPKSVLPLRLIHEYRCLPIITENPEDLCFITPWPPTKTEENWIYAICGKRAKWKLVLPGVMENKITELFGVGFNTLEGSGLEDFEETVQVADTEDQDAAIIRFVNEIIVKAVEDRATDIHFEPQKTSLQIRYRIDGELIPVQLPEQLTRFQAAIISRLKIMSRLNISERRRPQDGRIKFNAGVAEFDIRVSTFPTIFGESVSLRLLNQGGQRLTLAELGLLPEDQKKVEPIIRKPHGIILVTGPTGSGKSTTLSAFIREIRSPERRILTVEDPIENEIEGVNQTQVQPEIGLTFANALRHILRQDPDVIMVGEIRDRETADIAIRASLTGHLVLSTLHTNDSAGALTRLIDMEIEPFLLASSVEMIVAQRLVRRLCPHCAKPETFLPGELETALKSLNIDPSEAKYGDLAKGPVGCKLCHGLGYRGRLGIFEILVVDESIHQMIVQKQAARVMRQSAIDRGMRTLQQCGWEQVKLGNTSLKAILRFAEEISAEE